MTRTHTARAAWTWRCDACGREHALGREQSDLPSPDDMRARGWFIAKTWGDRCPDCQAKEGVQ